MDEVKTLQMELAAIPQTILAPDGEFAAALAWWRDAGVDGDWQDAPAGWLAEPAEVPAPQPDAAPKPESRKHAAEPAPPPAIGPDSIPQDLQAFTRWWLAEPALDSGRISGRVTPRGPIEAEVMVLVGEPEREDEAAGRLLSGTQGRLLDAMLAAMGIAPDQAYVASALPRHTPHADWAAVQQQGMGQVLARHIALAAPKCLITFGGHILPLLGHDPANKPGALRRFNHEGRIVPLLPARALAAMLERPRWKSAFWRSWLEWNGALETD